MPSLSTTTLLFISTFVLIVVTSIAEDVVPVPKPYELVDKVCGKLRHKHFCMEVLKSDTRSKFANNITTLTMIALDAATKNTTATREYFCQVRSGPPNVLKSLKDCIVRYNYVINGFKYCLREDDCSLIGYDIHDAGDEVRRCQAIANANGAQDSFITTSNAIIERFSGLGEYLANLMCNQTINN